MDKLDDDSNIINKYQVECYNKIKKEWEFFGQFSTLYDVSDSLELSYSCVRHIYKKKNKNLGKFLRINKLINSNKYIIKNNKLIKKIKTKILFNDNNDNSFKLFSLIF